jgi:hypothetical protein
MTTDSALAVQAALYERLSADAALGAITGAASVRDHVPPGTPFPYVVIGDMGSRPLDTQGGRGCEIAAELHAFSRAEGLAETKRILAALQDALHGADFAISGHRLVLCLCTGTEARLGEDGVTRHGVARFRIVTEPL